MFNVSKLIPNNEHSRTVLISCFQLKKTAPDSYRLLEKLMLMFNRKIRVNDGFGVSKVVISTHDKKKDKEHGKRPKNPKM